jgi:hypothetical protein
MHVGGQCHHAPQSNLLREPAKRAQTSTLLAEADRHLADRVALREGQAFYMFDGFRDFALLRNVFKLVFAVHLGKMFE